MSRKSAHVLIFLCAVLMLAGDVLSETYVSRLPNHAGYHLVSVEDALPAALRAPGVRPRHTVLVVIDGLRLDLATTMASVQRLRAEGQCRRTDVGPLSVSRPVYAVMSTGLEQDRTGSRNNDDQSPLAAESIWQVARQAGLRVVGTSELPWFQQLFPSGFDSYQLVQRAQDHFTAAESELGDLALIHPIYVDEAGHDFGGSSPSYAANVARADAELGRLLDRMDLRRDLVVLTADHGHTDRGGHGAGSDEVAQVLTCFGGHGVRRSADIKGFESRLVAPTLAVLLQVPFPRNLRAGEDSLDLLWEIADPGVYPAAYLADRRLAIEHFRAVNGEAVGRWLRRAGPGTWSELYSSARDGQLERGLVAATALVVIGALLRRRFWPARPLFFVAWFIAVCLAMAAVYSLLSGSFDLSSINARNQFIKRGALAALPVGALGMLGHFLLWRNPVEMVGDQVRFCLSLFGLNLVHIAAFGWPLGFPLPGQVPIFLPFIGGLFQVSQSLLAMLAVMRLGSRRRL